MLDIFNKFVQSVGYEFIAYATIGVIVCVIAPVMIAMARQIAVLQEELQNALAYVGNANQRGVYRIRCSITKAEYIGSTRSNFMSRWGQHIRDLNKGTHTSPRLQADWNQYGARAFQFMIVEVLDDPTAIVKLEREIIAERAATIPPMLNYNVAHSRVYPVPAAPEQV